MTYPKIRPCPECGSDNVTVYETEYRWKHVECDDCFHLGPGEGRKGQAIKSWNDRAQTEG